MEPGGAKLAFLFALADRTLMQDEETLEVIGFTIAFQPTLGGQAEGGIGVAVGLAALHGCAFGP